MKTNENNVVFLPRGKGKTAALLDHAVTIATNNKNSNILFVCINMDVLERCKEYIKDKDKNARVLPFNANIIFENGSRILFHTRYSVVKDSHRGNSFTDIIIDNIEAIDKKDLDVFIKNSVLPLITLRTISFSYTAKDRDDKLFTDYLQYLVGKSFHVYNDFTKLSLDGNKKRD